ncbi:MAG: DUF4921 family protein [bacterium]
MRVRTHYITMPDGTIKQLNPFSGTEVWYIPGRGSKPIANVRPSSAARIEVHRPEDYCDFCETQYLQTPPEKGRLVQQNGTYHHKVRLPASELPQSHAIFRRIANLFEIVTIDYWKKNYNFQLRGRNLDWKNEYVSSPAGLEHVLRVIHLKLRLSGRSEEDIKKMPIEDKFVMADALFSGGHDLVIAGRHYREGAEFDSDLYSSGDMTPEEHYQYFNFTIEAAKDLCENNRYVRYISIFQNWLAEAGASFNHLHKQIVSLDEWGTSVESEVDLTYQNPNIYNEYAANFAGYHNLVFAENEQAIAFVSIGHRSPTLAVFSKSVAGRPEEHTPEELRGVSDLVHACHAAIGSQVACNEEWYYTPRDCVINMPWHILIKLRINRQAGFEGGTKIYINTVAPAQLRDMIVGRLYELRQKGKIQVKAIAVECPVQPNSLKYYQKNFGR